MSRFLLSLVFVLSALPGGAAEPAELMLSEGFVRGLPPTVRNTAAYFTLHNHSAEELKLTGARSPAAESAGLHESLEQDGQMLMRPIAAAAIAPGGELVLEAGGLHLMLEGLRAPLAAGDEVELTLLFEGGLEKTVVLPVRDVRGEAASHRH